LYNFVIGHPARHFELFSVANASFLFIYTCTEVVVVAIYLLAIYLGT
jgi:hypothetical protein